MHFGAHEMLTFRKCASELPLSSVEGEVDRTRLSWAASCPTMNRRVFDTAPRPSIVFRLIDQSFYTISLVEGSCERYLGGKDIVAGNAFQGTINV
jgi:hypothetical protein